MKFSCDSKLTDCTKLWKKIDELVEQISSQPAKELTISPAKQETPWQTNKVPAPRNTSWMQATGWATSNNRSGLEMPMSSQLISLVWAVWFDFAWQQKKLDRQQTRSFFHKVCVHDLQSCGLDARLAFDSFFVGPCSHFFDYLASSLVCCSLRFVPFKKNQWHALGVAQEAPCSGKFAWLGDHPSLVNRTGASVEVVSEMEIVEFKKGWSCDVVGSHQLSLRSSAFQIVDSTFISWSVAWGWSSTRGTMQVPSEVASQFSCSKLCWLFSPFEHRPRQQGQLPKSYRQLWDS